MIELINVKKTYTTRLGVITQALNHVYLSLPDTGLVFILGKSGSGKSTLLNLLGGLDQSDGGEIWVDGYDLNQKSPLELDYYRCHDVGFVFQDFNIIEHYTIRENVGIALELQGKPIEHDLLEKTLATVGLQDFEKRKGNEVSGGQKQRIALARALIKQPRLMLADEPTGNLDSETSIQILDLLKTISKDTLVVVVSHDPEEAELYGDRILYIKDGEIVKDDVRAELSVKKERVQSKQSFLKLSASFKYGVHALRPKRLQILMTSLLLTFSLLISNLLGAYLRFLNQADLRLEAHFKADEIEGILINLEAYLTQADARLLLIGSYVLLLGIFYVFLSIGVEQRIKQMGIFRAIGARHKDVILIFIWEALVLGLSSFGLSSLWSLAYLTDINRKFFDGLQLFRLYDAQIVMHGIVALLVPSLFVMSLTLSTLRKNSVISILKDN